MQQPQERGTSARENSPGLAGALRSLASGAADYLHARAALLRAEGKEACRNWGKGVSLIAVAALLAVSGYFLLVAAVVAAVAHFSGWYWGWVLLGAGLLHLAAAVGAAIAAKRFFSAPAFRVTRNEFMKDQQWLKRTAHRP